MIIVFLRYLSALQEKSFAYLFDINLSWLRDCLHDQPHDLLPLHSRWASLP